MFVLGIGAALAFFSACTKPPTATVSVFPEPDCGSITSAVLALGDDDADAVVNYRAHRVSSALCFNATESSGPGESASSFNATRMRLRCSS